MYCVIHECFANRRRMHFDFYILDYIIFVSSLQYYFYSQTIAKF